MTAFKAYDNCENEWDLIVLEHAEEILALFLKPDDI